jgi:hypothetical protein
MLYLDYGLIMDKYYIKFPTMTKIINEKEIASVKGVVSLKHFKP